MQLPSLMDECDPPAEVARITADLIRQKSLSRELGVEPLPRAISDFINEEFSIARTELQGPPSTLKSNARWEADLLYRQVVHRCSPS